MKPTKYAVIASVLLATGVAVADDASSTKTWFKKDSLFTENLGTRQANLGEKLDTVKFAFDSARVEHDLTSVAETLRKDPSLTVVLDGYTDPTGSDTYNAKLSLRRAEGVRDRLVRLGINGDRIVMGVFGEEAPTNGSYADSRRVTIRTTTASPKEIIDQRLDPAIAVIFGQALDSTAFEDSNALENPNG